MIRFAHERRQEIVTRARRDGRVGVAELASEMDVTPETIRRDLSHLEHAGLIRRVHGGAISAERQSLAVEPEVVERAMSMMDEKRAIAARAVEELPDQGTVFLDAGTTTGELADLLPPGRQLTLVTNSLSIALSLAGRPGYRILTTGGEVRGTTLACVGPWADSRLSEIRTDVAFMATNGVSVDAGLTTPNHLEASTKRAIVAGARRLVLLADHTKFERDHFETFAPIEAVDLIITDHGLPSDVRDGFTSRGIDVTVV